MVALFEDAGFDHIDVTSTHPGKYIDPSIDVGEVMYVEIRGSTDFEKNTLINKSVYIKICYSLGPDEEYTPTRTQTTTVYISEQGSKYHSSQFCSGMDDPIEITIQEAESMGYTACKKCN